MIKKYKYIIGIFLIIFTSTIIVWQYLRKENIYILYNKEKSNCQNINKYESTKYPLCYNGKYLFEIKSNKPIIYIENLKKIKLTSTKSFFKYSYDRNVNVFLVIKKGNDYQILPVNIIQVLS
jgi:hypothetical protein